MGETYPEFTLPLPNRKEQLEEGDFSNNGLWLANIYIPEEVVLHILSYVDPKELVKYSLVCHKWNELIKSYTLWSTIYGRKYNRKAKKLPWYLYYCLLSTNYFNTNLLVNGNGQNGFNNWKIEDNGEYKFVIEDPPVGADLLPLGAPEFNNKTSCFSTSFATCYMVQSIKLGKSQLFQYILDNYKPHIYISEWTAGRFDYACVYRLECGFISKSSNVSIINPCVEHHVAHWEGHEWKKIEMTIEDYPEIVEEITFKHAGRGTPFCRGPYYGSKMAGGVVKLLFDSIEPLPIDEHGNKIPKKCSKVQFKTNAKIIQDPNQQCNTLHRFVFQHRPRFPSH